jgi:glycosyltransferase involved in cell wall biosynthesis
VDQLLVNLHYGDAVGNEALAIRGLLRRAGMVSEIFAEKVDDRLAAEARPAASYPGCAAPEDVCLFHLAVGEVAPGIARDASSRLVLVYHNVTPPEFFLGSSPELVRLGEEGRRLLAGFRDRAELALAKSEFSRGDLEGAGYRQTAVLPILFDFSRYERAPAPVARRLYGDGRRNLLFVGRLAPNKRVEDLIRAFAVYARHLDAGSRLLLVGSDAGQGRYRGALEQLARELRVRDQVVFAGHVDDAELAACYSVADLFLCLSEHEGFGVPLVEAMLFRVPVVAYDAGAVAETLGGAGVLLREKHPELVAELAWTLLRDETARRGILAGQDRRVAQLRSTDYGALLLERLGPVLGSPALGAR